jgi:hypothetical protein
MMTWAQFLDDIYDWKEDYQAKRTSSLTTRVAHNLRLNSRALNTADVLPRHDWLFLRDALATGALEELLEKSIELVGKSAEALRNRKRETDTHKYLIAFQKQLCRLLRDIQELTANATRTPLSKKQVMGARVHFIVGNASGSMKNARRTKEANELVQVGSNSFFADCRSGILGAAPHRIYIEYCSGEDGGDAAKFLRAIPGNTEDAGNIWSDKRSRCLCLV